MTNLNIVDVIVSIASKGKRKFLSDAFGTNASTGMSLKLALVALSFVSLAPFAQAGEIITQPWLQNVYTNRVTVMCETLGEMPGLSVVVKGVKEGSDSFEMASTNGLKEGTFVYQAQISLKPGKHPTYELATNGVAIAGTSGSVMAWQDEDTAFTCAIWGDNQEGVQKYDWGNDVAAERYRCITNMFVHMKQQKPDFGFSTGDFASDALYDEEIMPGELRGANDLFGRTIPYHLVWGNHDCSTSLVPTYTDAAQRYFAPAASEEDVWFYFYRNDVLFIGVHWLWERGAEAEKYKKAEKGIADLLATDRAKNAKFRIIVQHTPVYLETYSLLADSYWFVDSRLIDVAKEGGVDLVFSGHTHAYERIERDGIVQIVNGGMGYLDHGERWYNNYGSDTKVGGHQNTPLLWARQFSSSLFPGPSSLAPAQPVRMGCFQSYGMLSVTNNTLTYKAHAFNADGSYIGVADSFTLTSKTVPAPVPVDAMVSIASEKGVSLPPDAIGTIASTLTAPVNNATWKAYKDAQGEAWEKPAGAADTDSVVNVSKTEIERFCAALNAGKSTNYRLPTVAELTAAFGGNLKRDVSEWTADVDPNSGWCRILGGNKKAVDYTWCREYDKPAMASSDCHANYLGFRVIDAEMPPVVQSAMDKALAKLAKITNPSEVYKWNPVEEDLEDITKDWTKTWKSESAYQYADPVIFTGSGDLTYRVREEVVFGGGLAAPNATSLNLSHVPDLGIVSKPVTIKGEFRGGLAPDEWHFMLRCDELTLENVKYRGQVFNVVTDSRKLNLVGTNDFSGAVMSLCTDRVLLEPREDFINELVAKDDAMLWLRRLDFSNRGIVEEVLGQKAASFTVGENVTLVTTEDVLFAIDKATLAVDGALDAAGVDIAGHMLGLLPQEASLLGTGKVRTTHFGMCDKSTLNLGVCDTTLLSSVPYRTYSDPASGCNIKWIQRAPDYADKTGKDWLFHHDIAAKRYEGEPTQDPGVDLFYFYPTSVLVSDDHVVDGVCDIDDPWLRGPSGASNSWNQTAAVFGDFTRVYAPYYRQTPSDVEMPIGEQPNANAEMRRYWYDRAPYEDVTNALTHYFTVINPDGKRPFIFAGHSHGSGMLTLVMEHFFAEKPERKAWLKNMVACYAIGWGVSKDWEAKLNDDLDMHVATNATDAGVYIFWNTYGPNTNAIETILYPDPEKSAASVNPLLWTRVATNATADLNLGGWTTNVPPMLIPHLYDASNNVENGTIICTSKLVESQYLVPVRRMFGEHSLHGWDYKLYWENLRDNAYQRIKTATGKKPCCGTPTNYADADNWMKKPSASKGLDVFYLYPTCVPGTCTTLVGEIEDGMKAAANEHYKKGPSTFESYANVYAPYYRQGSALALVSDLSPDGIQRFCSTHVVKTDVFAALDYFFTNINVNAKRPFILASHSQGSANMKNVFEEYFVGEKASYTNTLVAAYVLGYKITPDWCEKVGVPFATCADDVRVVMTWNAEGPGDASDNFLTADPAQLAINPLNWKTDTTEALKASNLGSVVTNEQGVLYNTGKPGVTGTRLQANRPGTVIVDDPADIPVGISPGFGTKSYHFEDWGFFHDNIGANGFTRYAAFTGLAEVKTNQFVEVADATCEVKVKGEGEQWMAPSISPVDGKLYASVDATEVKVVYTLNGEASSRRFVNGETSTSFPMALKGGVWESAATEADVKAATKSGEPTVKLGVVAQRYPWNGTVDVNYKATFWPAGKKGAVEVTVGESVKTNDLAITGQGTVTGSTAVPMSAETKGKATFKVVK